MYVYGWLKTGRPAGPDNSLPDGSGGEIDNSLPEGPPPIGGTLPELPPGIWPPPAHGPMPIPPDLPIPPGSIWPPIEGGDPEAKYLALVWIIGVGYRWAALAPFAGGKPEPKPEPKA